MATSWTKVKRGIIESKAVVADLTGLRPNVLFEVGFATGVGRPVVPFTSDERSALAFDVSHQNVLKYEPGRTFHLMESLRSRLAAALSGTGR
ncbi:MAG: nucleoside 2-deoxyribosyltransferase [Actinomycetota bacterium]|nr:nucleoside 2-deoxyribosyltransferase [Actinomycetota bacterium]